MSSRGFIEIVALFMACSLLGMAAGALRRRAIYLRKWEVTREENPSTYWRMVAVLLSLAGFLFYVSLPN